jgi:predicted aspartyl protease
MLARLAPDALPLLDAWATALGGRDAIAALDVVHGKGTYELGGVRGTIEYWQTARGERREEIVLGPLRTVRVFDGKRGWLVDRNREVRELATFELDDELVVTFRESFAALVTDRRAGMVTRDGETLVLSPDGGNRAETVIFDRASHLPERLVRRDNEKMRTTHVSDWNLVAGVRMPFTVREETGNPRETVTIHWKTLDRGLAPSGAFSQPADRDPDMGLMTNPVTVPIELVFGGLIYVKVSINDTPMAFLLDTGAEATILNASRVAKLGLTAVGSFATGAGGGDVVLAFVPHVTTKVGGATVRDQIVGAIDLDAIEAQLKRPLDGILGYDFLSRFVIEIDYPSTTMRLFDRATYRHPGAGKPIPITLEDSTPALDAMIDVPGQGKLPGHYVLDTGCLCALTVFKPFVDQHKLLAAFPQAKQTGFSAGAGGATQEVSANIPALEIGEVRVTNPRADFARDTTGALANPESAGVIGSVVWGRFVLVLDYKGKQVFLDPTK